MELGNRTTSIESSTCGVKVKIKTLFISDIHLGTRGSKTNAVLDLLKLFDFEKLYLIGDFIDFWQLKSWNPSHTRVIQKILKKSANGTEVIYIPGNHDEQISNFLGFSFGKMKIKERDIHIAQDGKSILCMHGHELDAVTKNAKILSWLGSVGYDFLLWLNIRCESLRSIFGLKHWSLSKAVKSRVKGVVQYVSGFERGIVEYAKKEKCTHVIAGHIHVPSRSKFGDIEYWNCGDWVESITAIIEDEQGKLKLLNFYIGNDGHLLKEWIILAKEG